MPIRGPAQAVNVPSASSSSTDAPPGGAVFRRTVAQTVVAGTQAICKFDDTLWNNGGAPYANDNPPGSVVAHVSGYYLIEGQVAFGWNIYPTVGEVVVGLFAVQAYDFLGNELDSAGISWKELGDTTWVPTLSIHWSGFLEAETALEVRITNDFNQDIFPAAGTGQSWSFLSITLIQSAALLTGVVDDFNRTVATFAPYNTWDVLPSSPASSGLIETAAGWADQPTTAKLSMSGSALVAIGSGVNDQAFMGVRSDRWPWSQSWRREFTVTARVQIDTLPGSFGIAVDPHPFSQKGWGGLNWNLSSPAGQLLVFDGFGQNSALNPVVATVSPDWWIVKLNVKPSASQVRAVVYKDGTTQPAYQVVLTSAFGEPSDFLSWTMSPWTATAMRLDYISVSSP